MTTVCAQARNPEALRTLFQEIRRELGARPNGEQNAEHLARAVWELVTNLAHCELPSEASVVIDIEVTGITIRLPGPVFDSVARARVRGARGLDTAAWRLNLCGWSWSHRYVQGTNEVRLEQGPANS